MLRMQYFNIQLASQLSGVAAATIRAWEKRYNAVVPDRADNKHRLYSEADIEKLALLFSLTEIGQSIGKIAHLELEELKDIYTRLLHRPYEERQVVTPHHDKVDIQKMLSSFLFALSAYKLDILSHELEKAKTLLTPKDLCLKILVPLFQEIGSRVNLGEITTAQEHILSALVRFYIGQMIGQHYQKTLLRNELVLISTPEGETHEIGILGAALLCVHYGIKFIFLGTNLPPSSLAEAANALGAKAVLLGATKKDAHSQKNFDEYLANLKLEMNPNVEFWIGGNMKPSLRGGVEKNKIKIFSSLDSLNSYLENF